MTPNDMEILMYFHTCPEPHPRRFAPAVDEAILRFCQDGIIEDIDPAEGAYRTTWRGKAFVQMILNTPYPTQAWIDQNGNIIEITK